MNQTPARSQKQQVMKQLLESVAKDNTKETQRRIALMLHFNRKGLKLLKGSLPLLRRLTTYSKEKPVLTLFTKDQCPLCEEAKEMLHPYKHRFVLQEVDITLPENSAFYERYKYDIPVFHLNGQFLMMHRVNVRKLEQQLRKLEQQFDQSSYDT